MPIPHVGLEHFRVFARSGDQDQFRVPYFARRRAIFLLAIAQSLKPEARLLDHLADLVWAVCDEGCWVHAAHVENCSRNGRLLPESRPVDQGIDLFAAETGTQLAIVRRTVGRDLAERYPSVSERLDHEMIRRVIRPYLERSDYWWMGLEEQSGATPAHMNNWNPWINSNALFCALAAPVDDKVRTALAEKVARSVGAYLSAQATDWACDEGPTYWGHAAASTLDCFRLLVQYHQQGIVGDATMSLVDRENIVRMGEYIAHLYAGNGEQIMFSDAGPTLDHDPVLIADYAKLARNETMHELALVLRARMSEATHAAPIPPWGGGFRAVRHLLRVAELDDEIERSGRQIAQREDRLDQLRIVYPETQVAVARSSQSRALFAAKGGHNGQNHNHNDLGTFIYRVEQRTIVPDLGRAHYSGANFSDQRYTITQNRSAYHAIPMINGTEQAQGREFEAVLSEAMQDERSTHIVFALEKAYPADTATGLRFSREFTFSSEDGSLSVSDSLAASDELEVTWTLMLAAPPQIVAADESGMRLLLGGLSRSRDGRLTREDGVAELRLTATSGHLGEHLVERVNGDQELAQNWGDELRRFQVSVHGNPVRVLAEFKPA